MLSKLHGLGFIVPVVLLTDKPLPAHECLALDKGAVDVVCRSRGPAVLARRIKGAVKVAHRTRQPRSDNSMICGKLLLRPDVSRAYWKDADLDLTLGEYNIVHLLASNVGPVMRSSTALAHRLHYEGFGRVRRLSRERSSWSRIRNKFCDLDPTFDADRKLCRFRILLEEASLDRVDL